MKRVAILVVVLGVIFGGYYIVNKKNKVEYIAPEKQIVKETVEVETLNKRINDALSDKKTAQEIEAKSYQAYLDEREKLEKEIELNVTRKYNAEINAKVDALEKQVSL